VVGTICNAGWLATAGEYGTALGVIKVAHEQGKQISVIALETRPVLQGARLTAFELKQDGIPVKVIPDGAIGYCLAEGLINKFICGADRVVWRSGCHVFNKIGTYTVALAVRRHCIPFYVAAPFSTFDFNHELMDIVIEERHPREVTEICGCRMVPESVSVINPAFDVTPPELINAIITEKGVIYPPFKETVTVLRNRVNIS
jgi:methylthioribose-1-phosphate isomerase